MDVNCQIQFVGGVYNKTMVLHRVEPWFNAYFFIFLYFIFFCLSSFFFSFSFFFSCFGFYVEQGDYHLSK